MKEEEEEEEMKEQTSYLSEQRVVQMIEEMTLRSALN